MFVMEMLANSRAVSMFVTTNFTILKKCKSKFDCLIYEMVFINEVRPSLNIPCDSIRAKVLK